MDIDIHCPTDHVIKHDICLSRQSQGLDAYHSQIKERELYGQIADSRVWGRT